MNRIYINDHWYELELNTSTEKRLPANFQESSINFNTAKIDTTIITDAFTIARLGKRSRLPVMLSAVVIFVAPSSFSLLREKI